MLQVYRKYAFRLGLRRKVALATVLLLLCLPLALGQGSAFLFLSLLGFFYPSHLEQKRALSAIDQRGLAYRSWLETGPNHPYHQSITQAAQNQTQALAIPGWPWREFLLYGLLLAGLYLWVWLSPPQISLGSTSPPPASPQEIASQPATPAEAVPETTAPAPSQSVEPTQLTDTPPAGTEPTPSEPAGNETGSGSTRDPGQSGAPGGSQSEPESSPASENQSPATDRGSGQGEATDLSQTGSGSTQGLAQPEANSGTPAEPAPNGVPDQTTTGEGTRPGSTGAPGGTNSNDQPGGENVGQGHSSGGPKAHELSAEGPISTLERAPVQGDAGAGQLIANPWPGGTPPDNVQRAAESYLQNEPLEAGARKAVQRYFELAPE